MESPQLHTSVSKPRRRKGNRTVSGCLTCRRRRVKCSMQSAPCDNCRRLKLACTPSFHSNFINWTLETTTNPHGENDSPLSPSEAAPGPEGGRQISVPQPYSSLNDLGDLTYTNSSVQHVGILSQSQTPEIYQQPSVSFGSSYDHSMDISPSLAFSPENTTNHSLPFTTNGCER
jgi:hypothetical protein